MKVLLIIPAYNEAGSIEQVVRDLIDHYPQYDYVIINDGSEDGTEAICRKNHYHFISHPVNLGLVGAFKTGMRYAMQHGYDAAMQFDGDGQHNPAYIAPMIEQIEAGYNIVIGSRFAAKKKPFSMRMIGNDLIRAAIRLTTGKTISDPTSGMRLYDKTMIRKLATAEDLGPEPDTLAFLIRKKARVTEVQAEMNERTAGKSYLTAAKSIRYMLSMMVSILVLQWIKKGE